MIGLRIKERREQLGLTQKQLGKELGVSAQQVSHYEVGYRSPFVDTLIRIGEALDVSILYFIDEEE